MSEADKRMRAQIKSQNDECESVMEHEGKYVCNCGRIFPHPYARIAHGSECIHMAMERKLDIVSKQLEIAIGALKSCIGYEPFENTLDPYLCSRALTKIAELRSSRE